MSYHRPHAGVRLYDGQRTLASRQVIAAHALRHPAQVTRRCRAIACDVATRCPLYDFDDCLKRLSERRRVA